MSEASRKTPTRVGTLTPEIQAAYVFMKEAQETCTRLWRIWLSTGGEVDHMNYKTAVKAQTEAIRAFNQAVVDSYKE